MGLFTTAGSDRDQIAVWEAEGDDFVLRVKAANARAALSPWPLGATAAFGAVAGVISLVAGADPVFAITLGVLLFGLLLSLVYYVRLSLQAHTVVLRFGRETVEVQDGDGAPSSHPLTELTRVLITHDGAPSKIGIDVAGRRLRWTIGQLYRHNTILPFVDPIPEPLRARLLGCGLRGSTVMRRKIRISEYRR